EYIVVFQDDRNQDWDIYGVRLDEAGKKLPSENQQADSTFIICDQVQAQTSPRVAVNTQRNTSLIVWVDQRNTMTAMTEVDIYGQRLGPGGKLIVSEGTPDTKLNIPIAAYPHIMEYYPDVAYHGRNGKILEEWLVVYNRSYAETHDMGASIWGVRVKGVNGRRLNTFGEEIAGIGKAARIQGGGPPWFPDFPIGYSSYSPDYSSTYQGSPHVESNDVFEPAVMLKTAGIYEYPIPEFFVAWSEFRYGQTQIADIFGQRIAYFPDSTAFRLGLKPAAVADSLFTAVLIDAFGDWELPPEWFPGPSVQVCSNEYYQSYNNISYDQNYGCYLVVWNDWRSTEWDGSWESDEGWTRPPADIYGQRLWLNPADTTLAWLDHDGTDGSPPDLNTPIAFLETADEGNSEYPAVAHSPLSGKFLVAYEYVENQDGIDVYGNLYAGTPPIRVGVESQRDAAVLRDFTLFQNWPNPFNPVTEITYSIGRTGRVDLAIYNTRGQKIMDLCAKVQNPGTYHVSWDGKNASGMNVPSGIYLYRLAYNGFETSRKMALVR
ncbi:T9SS type A sorting domain-containing protein, partial [bacterium]|nr:T9SS type A sorting domain-containing protein [bacterium]